MWLLSGGCAAHLVGWLSSIGRAGRKRHGPRPRVRSPCSKVRGAYRSVVWTAPAFTKTPTSAFVPPPQDAESIRSAEAAGDDVHRVGQARAGQQQRHDAPGQRSRCDSHSHDHPTLEAARGRVCIAHHSCHPYSRLVCRVHPTPYAETLRTSHPPYLVPEGESFEHPQMESSPHRRFTTASLLDWREKVNKIGRWPPVAYAAVPPRSPRGRPAHLYRKHSPLPQGERKDFPRQELGLDGRGGVCIKSVSWRKS